MRPYSNVLHVHELARHENAQVNLHQCTQGLNVLFVGWESWDIGSALTDFGFDRSALDWLEVTGEAIGTSTATWRDARGVG